MFTIGVVCYSKFEWNQSAHSNPEYNTVPEKYPTPAIANGKATSAFTSLSEDATHKLFINLQQNE